MRDLFLSPCSQPRQLWLCGTWVPGARALGCCQLGFLSQRGLCCCSVLLWLLPALGHSWGHSEGPGPGDRRFLCSGGIGSSPVGVGEHRELPARGRVWPWLWHSRAGAGHRGGTELGLGEARQGLRNHFTAWSWCRFKNNPQNRVQGEFGQRSQAGIAGAVQSQDLDLMILLDLTQEIL